MTIELSNDQKKAIVNEHLNNLIYTKYSIELSIKEINASSQAEKIGTDALESQLLDIAAQVAVLEEELDQLD